MNNKRKIQLNWSREAVVYQIYPRSFKDSNNDGIGDLQGIIDKLDYLNDGTEKSLGIGAIWLSPIYKSPMVDFGYDISDYMDIDSQYGSLETFNKLIKEAHKRNIKVIMDFVANHTSSKHPWFMDSRSSKTNPKRDWYIWKDPKPDGSPPNNWLSVFGGSAWTLDKTTNQYYLHSFLPEQPDLNWRNNEVKKAMEKVLEFWIHRGADGFRSDAAYHLIKDDQLRDDPPNPTYKGVKNSYKGLIHTYSQGRPEALETMNTFCSILGLHKDKYMVSEAYLDIPEMSKLYKACSNNLHAPFNFNLISLPWDAKLIRKHIDDFEASLSKIDWPNYVLGNHDKPRVVTRVGEKRARLLAMLLFTLRGMPFVYYGDEIGMKNEDIPLGKQKDLVGNRLTANRDGERTPMQWDESVHAGFSIVKPWLPVGEKYKDVNVKKELSDPISMLRLYRQLIHYRANSYVLLRGSYRSLDLGDNHVFAYLRELGDEKVLVILNFSKDEESVSFPYQKANVIYTTNREKENKIVNLKKITLAPYQGYVLEVKG
ncbi:alpha-glucosidase C-terminal domain-containing protein [Candidatus Curtissbacteria bacterium]|nr:alpha-glucosidase C-terminal domain-containing protein [Candidatus Curtissbacteria bacterium]